MILLQRVQTVLEVTKFETVSWDHITDLRRCAGQPKNAIDQGQYGSHQIPAPQAACGVSVGHQSENRQRINKNLSSLHPQSARLLVI
jgi:hypothetical protein